MLIFGFKDEENSGNFFESLYFNSTQKELKTNHRVLGVIFLLFDIEFINWKALSTKEYALRTNYWLLKVRKFQLKL